MIMSERIGIRVLGGAMAQIAFELGGRRSVTGVHSTVSTTQAIAERSLTSVISVAGSRGVARPMLCPLGL